MIQAPALPPYRSLSPEIMRYDSEHNDISNDPKDAPLRNGHLALEVCSLQQEIMKVAPSMACVSDPEAIESIFERCLAVDRKFQDWRRTLPSYWEVSTPWFGNDQSNTRSQSSPTTSTFRLSHMLTYPTLHIAEMYNQHRLHRIKLQVIIMKCAFKQATSHDYQSEEYAEAIASHRTAHRICLDTVNDICATIPFHFGEKPAQIGPQLDATPAQVPTLDPQSRSRSPLQSTTPNLPPSGRNPPQPALRKNMGYFMLLQPLLFAQAVVGVPDGQREWILEQAREICGRTGMDEGMIGVRFEGMRREWREGFWPIGG